MAYTPGLEVSANTRVSRVRELPLPGQAMVTVGQRVDSSSEVLKTELPGEVDVIRLAERMGLDTLDVLPGVKIKEGDSIKKGEILCEVATFFGLFRSQVTAPLEGTVEFFTETNAHVGIRKAPTPLSVDAYISGVVTNVEEGKSVTIETDAALIQGIFGVGGENQGKVKLIPQANDARVTVETLQSILEQIPGSVLVGGSNYSSEALHFAASHKAAAVVTGSVDADTLRHYVGYEIGVSITGDEDVPFPFIITEGFGQLAISERITDLAKKLEGEDASVNGTTQVRAGAMRPELIVAKTSEQAERSQSNLEVGVKVRLIRVPYFGEFATVEELPTEPAQIESGAKVRVLKARLSDGRVVTVPRANVELI